MYLCVCMLVQQDIRTCDPMWWGQRGLSCWFFLIETHGKRKKKDLKKEREINSRERMIGKNSKNRKIRIVDDEYSLSSFNVNKAKRKSKQKTQGPVHVLFIQYAQRLFHEPYFWQTEYYLAYRYSAVRFVKKSIRVLYDGIWDRQRLSNDNAFD